MRVFTAFSKLGKHLTVISSFCLPPLPLKVWTVCVQAHDTASEPTEPFFMYFRFLCPLSSWVSLNAIYFSTIDLFFRYICLLVNSVCIFLFCISLYFSVFSFSFCILFLNFRYKKIFRHSFEFFKQLHSSSCYTVFLLLLSGRTTVTTALWALLATDFFSVISGSPGWVGRCFPAAPCLLNFAHWLYILNSVLMSTVF